MLLDRLHELGNIDVLAPVFKDMGENGARAAQVISALAGNLDMVRWEQEEATKAFAGYLWGTYSWLLFPIISRLDMQIVLL